MNDEMYDRVVAGSGAVVMSLLEALETQDLGTGFMVALDAAKVHPDWFAEMVRQFQGPATFSASARQQLDALVWLFPTDPDALAAFEAERAVREVLE